MELSTTTWAPHILIIAQSRQRPNVSSPSSPSLAMLLSSTQSRRPPDRAKLLLSEAKQSTPQRRAMDCFAALRSNLARSGGLRDWVELSSIAKLGELGDETFGLCR